jgi:maltooligosyltrehalose trehalohydrolase
VIGPDAFVLRFFAPAPGDERLLVVNFGRDLVAGSLPEPLVAAPDDHEWQVRWSSENPEYGGLGAPPALDADGWRIAGQSACVLEPVHGRH